MILARLGTPQTLSPDKKTLCAPSNGRPTASPLPGREQVHPEPPSLYSSFTPYWASDAAWARMGAVADAPTNTTLQTLARIARCKFLFLLAGIGHSISHVASEPLSCCRLTTLSS
eukprot:scaffold292556_cov19-Tisochrysis_lutea.AAC.2